MNWGSKEKWCLSARSALSSPDWFKEEGWVGISEIFFLQIFCSCPMWRALIPYKLFFMLSNGTYHGHRHHVRHNNSEDDIVQTCITHHRRNNVRLLCWPCHLMCIIRKNNVNIIVVPIIFCSFCYYYHCHCARENKLKGIIIIKWSLVCGIMHLLMHCKLVYNVIKWSNM